MEFSAALIKEKDMKIILIRVKYSILNSFFDRERIIENFSKVFPGFPIILASLDARDEPAYYGEKSIVNILFKIDFKKIPWKKYTI